MQLIGQMFPGMEYIIFAAWAIIFIGVAIGFAVLWWLCTQNFGLTIERSADGKPRVTISLRNLLIWVACAPLVIAVVYSVWNWRADEMAAERDLASVGATFVRWNDAILPFEYEGVLFVDFSKSSAGRHEFGLLARLPDVCRVTLGQQQLQSENLEIMPEITQLVVQSAKIDVNEAQALIACKGTRFLLLKNCVVTDDAREVLEQKFGGRLQME